MKTYLVVEKISLLKMLQSKENTSSLGELSYNISFVRKKVRSNFFNSDKIVRPPPFEQN